MMAPQQPNTHGEICVDLPTQRDDDKRLLQRCLAGLTMAHYHYLIVGGGMTADAAVQGIRDRDSNGSIGLVSAEPDPPYNRPPLSKGLWKGKPIDRIRRQTTEKGAQLHLGRTAVRLELPGKRIITDDGTVFTFEKLLLATGGTPRRLPFGGEDILYFRTLEDYKQLRAWTNEKQRFAVIGGGFIGSEIAAALATNGKAVTLVFPDEGIGARLFPADLSRFLNEYYREHGVEVLPGHTVMDLRQTVSGWQLVLRHELSGDEKTVDVDGVVAGIGLVPNTTLAEESGLSVGDGIVVDELLRAGHPDVYAAGDVANFYNPALAMHVRFEHEDNANAMGRCAGRNMAGDSSPYHHLPFFYSDLFDLGYEAIGLLNPDLETVTEWSEPFRKGVIVYLRDRQVRGVLLWNVWEKLDAARALIAKGEPFQPEDFKALL